MCLCNLWDGLEVCFNVSCVDCLLSCLEDLKVRSSTVHEDNVKSHFLLLAGYPESTWGWNCKNAMCEVWWSRIKCACCLETEKWNPKLSYFGSGKLILVTLCCCWDWISWFSQLFLQVVYIYVRCRYSIQYAIVGNWSCQFEIWLWGLGWGRIAQAKKEHCHQGMHSSLGSRHSLF